METSSQDITLPDNYDAYGDLDGSVQFSYDACGNMTANTNKEIMKMTYNLLNQPASIYFRNGTVIRYDYSADGERLRARYGTVKYNVAIPEAGIMTADFQPSDTTGYNIKSTTIYDGRYTFYPYHSKTGKLCANLEDIRIDGGIVKEFRKGYPTLLYEITDHHGNVRYVATASGAYITMYQYYPFDGYFDGGTKCSHPYLYGGKEMEKSNGLDEYDFEARNYDPALCRFNTMDPLSEKYYSISPYAYCADNPIRYVDPDGNEVKPAGTTELEMIKNTLPQEDRKFVVLNDKGVIDKKQMSSHRSNSENYKHLLFLVNPDDVVVNVKLTKEKVFYYDNNGKRVLDNDAFPMLYQGVIDGFEDKNFVNPNAFTTGEVGRSGVTLLPGHGSSGVNSPDKDIYIYINSQFSDIGRAESFSHEAYGHAYLYLLTGNREISGHFFDRSHDTNKRLDAEILRARKETIENIENVNRR